MMIDQQLAKAIEEQYRLPPGIRKYGKTRRFGLSAFIAGWEAARAGKTSAANPYPDYRTGRGSVTFSRAYRRVWQKGFTAYNLRNEP